MGRISQELKNFPEALSYYNVTMENNNKKSYMLCNAALQSALILEEQKRYDQALFYIEKCLSIKPNKYRSSLHQKAKAARERINNN
jgi:tetratricopeptide (TPR) repeat protein